MTVFKALFLVLFVFISPISTMAGMTGDIMGVVVGVHDGDTITVLTPEKKSIKIRLAEIDAPESKQPYGAKAKQALSDLVFEKEVKVEIQDIDRYGRTVGKIFQDDGYINAVMVQSGHAWVYRQYSNDPSLLNLEQEAKAQKLGLWSLPEADQIPPWAFRQGKQQAQSIKISDEKSLSNVICPMDAKICPDGSSVSRTALNCEFAPCSENENSPVGGSKKNTFSCGWKTKCKQMSSCAEAQHYLQNCGLSRLDGDNDGIPCEALCR